MKSITPGWRLVFIGFCMDTIRGSTNGISAATTRLSLLTRATRPSDTRCLSTSCRLAVNVSDFQRASSRTVYGASLHRHRRGGKTEGAPADCRRPPSSAEFSHALDPKSPLAFPQSKSRERMKRTLIVFRRNGSGGGIEASFGCEPVQKGALEDRPPMPRQSASFRPRYTGS